MRKLAFFFLLICFSKLSAQNAGINSDTLTISTKIADSSQFRVDSFNYQKNLLVWVRLINTSGKSLQIEKIGTNDGGSYAICTGQDCNNIKLKKSDTLLFCIIIPPGGKTGPLKRDVHISYYDTTEKKSKSQLVRFSLLTYVKKD